MRLSCLIAYLLFTASVVIGQRMIPPAAPVTDTSLRIFLAQLQEATQARDTNFILHHLDPQVMSSFGGNDGIPEFKTHWDWDHDLSDFWATLNRMLALGGGEYTGGETYFLPYVFSEWPEEPYLDVFTHAAITGTRVNVRDRPNLTDSRVIGQLSYDLVRLSYEKNYLAAGPDATDEETTQQLWYYVESLNSDVAGYVHGDYVQSPIDYRLGLSRRSGGWMIRYLIAGD